MGWKIGDLGRFRCEDPSRPRFEVVQASKDGVTVWYAGSQETQLIPLRSFKYDCVSYWNSKPVAERSIPKWLKPGVEFMLTKRNIVQAVIKERVGKTFQGVQIGNNSLRLRQIRADFTSNLLMDNTLVLLSLHDIIRYGCHQSSRYERLRAARDPIRDDDLEDF